VHALGLGDTAPHEIGPLADAVTEYRAVRDMNVYEDVLRATASFIARYGRIDRIDSLNEHWLPLEAKLREDFNVPGPKPAELDKHRSKSGMRELFKAAKVKCTEGERVVNADQVRAFAKRVGYPLVFKPDVGVGAWSTFKVASDAELEAALQKSLDGFVVERFAKGRLISYDGLADRTGRPMFETSHIYSTGVMDVVNEQLDVWYYNRRKIPLRLREIGVEVLKAFGVRERFFHLELFEEPDGGYRALEINLRPPGGFTTDMMNYSSDADVYALWAQLVAGRDMSGYMNELKYHCAHISRRNSMRYRVPHHEVVQRLGSQLVLYRTMPAALSGAMGDHEYLVRDEDEVNLLKSIEMVAERA
jgi:biotin carboxylase